MKTPRLLVISDYRSTVSVRPEAEIFIGLARRGFEITIMTYPEAAYISQFKAAGIKVIPWHPEKKRNRNSVQRIRQAISEGGIDVLQMYNSRAYRNGIAASKGLPVKVVLYRGYQGNLEWYAPSLYGKYFHPRVDHIICNSIGVEEEFRKHPFIKWGNKLLTINKGHRPEWYDGIVPADLSPFGVKPGSFVLTCIANARPMKGVVYLMKAMQLLPPGMNLNLLMVGRGLETPRFRKMADQSPYKERITFTGFHTDPLGVDAASDVFILPSIYGESITKGVIEAMGVGIAPLITDIPGNRHLIVHKESGLMVSPRNPAGLAAAIEMLYNDRTLCSTLGQNARKRISTHLNTDTTIAEMEKFYRSLMPVAEPYMPLPSVL